MRRILAASFAVLSLSLVMGACSSDSKKVADIVTDNLKKETNVQDLKVTCDSKLEAKKGNKGTCTATTGGDFGPFLTSTGRDVGSTKVTELKFNIEFISDTTFNPSLDEADLQGKIAGAGGGGTATSSADTASSVDTASSSS